MRLLLNLRLMSSQVTWICRRFLETWKAKAEISYKGCSLKVEAGIMPQSSIVAHDAFFRQYCQKIVSELCKLYTCDFLQI